MTHSKLKGLTLFSVTALLAAGQAFAHTGVRDQADEGKASYNGFTITHGCGSENGLAFPVIGQSSVFPDGANAVWKDQAGNVVEVGGNGKGTISAATLALGVTGYASMQSPFAVTQELVDGLGNVQGLLWKNGAMEPKLNAITPFKITAPTIVNNCVKTLKIRIGVINYCDVGKNAANDAEGPYEQPKDAFGNEIPITARPATGNIQANVKEGKGQKVYPLLKKGNGDNNRQDWWFTAPYGGSALYNDPDLLQPTYWTTLTVNNSAADLANCAGSKVDMTVEPAGAAFDSILNGPNTRPFTAGNANF